MTILDANTVLSETREEVTRADAKASLLLSAALIVVGVIAAAMLAGDWSPSRLDNWGQALWWFGTAMTLAGITCLAIAVYPRVLNRHEGPGVTYFNEIAKLKGVKQLKEALAEVDADDRTIKQLYSVSKIARRKYAFVAVSIWFFAAAATSLLIAVIAGG